MIEKNEKLTGHTCESPDSPDCHDEDKFEASSLRPLSDETIPKTKSNINKIKYIRFRSFRHISLNSDTNEFECRSGLLV